MIDDLARLLDELEAAHGKGTTGPWWTLGERADGGAYVDAEARRIPGRPGSSPWVGRTEVADDAALIVAAVNALPTLIAELRRRDAALAGVLAPFEELFGGGPDTPCRTTWRAHPTRGLAVRDEECCEVPMAALRDAFDRAHAVLAAHEQAEEAR